MMRILCSNETFHQVGFWTQIHGFLGGFDFWSENFYTKKVINTMLITQNNMWITFALKLTSKQNFPPDTQNQTKTNISFPLAIQNNIQMSTTSPLLYHFLKSNLSTSCV